MRRVFLATLALFFLLVGGIATAGVVPVPALTAHVTDETGTLDSQQVQSLESTLAAFEQSKGSQVAILIVPTTGDETLEQYSIRVVDAWKLGRKSVDDGVLVIVARDDHKVRIEVGRGLEGTIPDAIANRIIDETIVPKFKRNDFAGGLSDGVARITGLIDGEPLPPPSSRDNGGSSHSEDSFGPALIAFFVARLLFQAVKPAIRGLLVGSAVGGVAMVTGASVGFAVFLALLGFVVALITQLGGGRYTGGGGWGGWGGGSSGGGWGGWGGGSSGGGFSGGGGGFSGGGASGGW